MTRYPPKVPKVLVSDKRLEKLYKNLFSYETDEGIVPKKLQAKVYGLFLFSWKRTTIFYTILKCNAS